MAKTKTKEKKEEQLFKARKVRIYPHNNQKKKIRMIFASNRFVYNYFYDELQKLNEKRKAFIEEHPGINKKKNDWDDETKEEFKTMKFPSRFDLSKQLPKLKKQNEWLKKSDARSMEDAINNLLRAYKNMFEGRGKYPKPKNFVTTYTTSIVTSQKKISINNKAKLLKIPKIGYVYFSKKDNLDMESIQSITVSEDNLHDFYASVMYKDKIKPETSNNLVNAVGINLGIADLAVLSNGEKIPTVKFNENSRKDKIRLRKMSRRQSKALEEIAKFNHAHKHDNKELSLKDFPSYQKMKKAVGKVKKRRARQRLDYIHRITSSLVEKYDVIVIENLNVSHMLSNKYLSHSIANAAWRTFRQQLEYKCESKGKRLVIIPAYNTSRICSSCGYNDGAKPLRIRNWVCPNCNAHLDRDVNSAKNILNDGLEQVKEESKQAAKK